MGLDSGCLKKSAEGGILDGIRVIHDQRFVLQHFYGHLFFFCQVVAGRYAEHHMIGEDSVVVHLINIVKMHIDEREIQMVFLDKGSGPDGAVLKELYWNIRIFFLEGEEHVGEEQRAQERRDTDFYGNDLLS